eukprot:TRINITY_DN12160_c0_g1_i1.p1 TRINITY_DN12160_c0_g1~~TRINITY_DN12160_c0_g1_i1.p1  ORF type:complete len:881 (+),score=105.12 TRINITY_DN12160_c0_g1_i1:121-2643(+)
MASANSESRYPMISVDDALRQVLEMAEASMSPTESVNLCAGPAALVGRTLAEDVVAPGPLPPFRASIMDGYAVVASDGPGSYPVVGNVTAGVNPQMVSVRPGTVSYITTGAPLPEGADAVVPVENTVRGSNGTVQIITSVNAGQWVREIGSDVAEGALVLEKYTTLSAAEIGILATVGATTTRVFRKPRVGILSTGDEIVEASVQSVSQGKIRDSNRPMLLSAVAEVGADPVDLGITGDKAGIIEAMFTRAANMVDVLITSGGVSMGSLDLVKPTLERLGTVHFGRLCMKPGMPTTFATIASGERRCLVFGLPGNPVSTMVTFTLLVRPCLKRMSGTPSLQCHHARVNARLSNAVVLDPVRPEYHRVDLAWKEADGRNVGEFVATSTGMQRSSRLMSMISATALLCVPQGRGSLPPGTVLPALMLGNSELPPPKVVTPHMDSRIASVAVAAPPPSTKGSDSSPQQQVHLPTCPCCRAKAEATAAEDNEPPPLNGGSANAGGSQLRVGVLTVSDRAAQGVYKDRGGPQILRIVAEKVQSLWEAEYRVVPDEQPEIEDAIRDMAGRLACGLVITTGGTGPAPRDVTPEATTAVCERMLPGFGEQMRSISLRNVPTAALSRQTAGICRGAVVLNLPGHPSAIKETLPEIFTPLAACIELLGKAQIILPANEYMRGDAVAMATQSQSSKRDIAVVQPLKPSTGASAEPVGSGSISQKTASSPQGSTEAYDVDKANIEWIHKVMQAYSLASPSDVVNQVIDRASTESLSDASVRAFIFEKARGVNRAKLKQDIDLALQPAHVQFLVRMMKAHSIPSLGKALRIVLDWALEDANEASFFGVASDSS